MRYKQIITVCGVLVALSMFAVGGVSADNASDYPPIDVESTVEIYDGNDSLNDSVELDHARGYDDESIAVWDCSVGDCSSSNLSAFAGSGTLEVVSQNNMTISRNADGWEFSTSGTNPEAVVEANLSETPSNGTSTISTSSTGGQIRLYNSTSGSWTAYSQLTSGTVTQSVNGTDGVNYLNGSEIGEFPAQPAVSDTGSAVQFKFTTDETLSGVSILDRSVSSGEASLLHDGYRLGAFVPSETTTTGQTLPDNASLTWDVNRLRDAETTLKVQSYDGADWVTEETLTVDQTAEYDIGVGGGEEYRFVSEPNSTVDSGGGGYFFGGGSSTLNIFGVVVTRGTATGLSGIMLLLLALAFYYPGMRLFGRGSDQ
jgi:hypothetical protein